MNFYLKKLYFKKEESFILVKSLNIRSFTIKRWRISTGSFWKHLTFKGINNINDVLKYKGEPIFINRDDVKFPDYLDEELIGLDVWSDRYCGFVYDVIKTKTGRILEVHKEKVHLVPYHKAFVKKVDLKKKIIKIEEIKGLIDED